MNGAALTVHRSVLLLDGLFCTACAASIERVLQREPGVENASVNFAADAAVVAWRGSEDTPQRLCRRIERLGYGAALTGQTDGSSTAKDRTRALQLRLGVGLFFAMWTMLPAMGLYLAVSDDPRVMLGLAWASGLFSLPVVLWCGLPFYRMGLNTLRLGIGGVDAMITLGVAGSLLLSATALARGSWDVYFEVPVALVVLQLIARLIDARVRQGTREAVLALLELVPSRVRVPAGEGSERTVALADIEPGDRVLCAPGDTAAVDGQVELGSSLVDASLFNGESTPVLRGPGDRLHAGEQVLDGTLRIRVSAASSERRVDALSRLVGRFLAGRPPWQRVLDLTARWFLLGAALAATLAAGVALLTGDGWSQAAERALATFVVACPCALALAAPLPGLFASATASRAGLILRDLSAVTRAARPNVLFVDKTGTLTEGRPRVVAVRVTAADESEDSLLAVAAWAETGISHPLARAVTSAATAVPDRGERQDAPTRVFAGCGVERGEIRVGSAAWLTQLGLQVPSIEAGPLTRVWVARGTRVLGALDIDDALREAVPATLHELRARGLRLELLSGDDQAAVDALARTLAIDARAGQSPEDKVAAIRDAQHRGATVAFVGDGLNDGPALAAADLGIAVSNATDTARAAAAVNVLDGGIDRVPELLTLTARTRKVIQANLYWALGYNGVAVGFAMTGVLHPAIAALAMAASSLTILLNSLRAARRDLVPSHRRGSS